MNPSGPKALKGVFVTFYYFPYLQGRLSQYSYGLDFVKNIARDT